MCVALYAISVQHTYSRLSIFVRDVISMIYIKLFYFVACIFSDSQLFFLLGQVKKLLEVTPILSQQKT